MRDIEANDDARALHAESPPVDLHADPLLWARLLGYDLNRRHRAPFPRAWFGGHTDIPRMQEGGMGGQFFGLVSLPGLDRDLEAACHRQIDLLEKASAASGGALRIARSVGDVEHANAEGAIAALIGIEGAHALGGRVDALDRFAARGVRYLGLLHFTANDCGAPAKGRGAEPERGLTPHGHDVIARCVELGVLVDLAHINKRGFMEACDVMRAPPYVSHTGVSGVHRLWRNVDDEQLRAVAARGGAVGVIFCPYFLGADGVDAVVEHVIHVVRVAGEDTPALGSDWDGFIRPTRGLEDPARLFRLTEALRARGLPRRTVSKILRHNALRVLRSCS